MSTPSPTPHTSSATAPPTSAAASTAATSTPPVPATIESTAPGTAILLTAVISGAVIAAVITACITMWIARRKSREEERARQRDTFAKAFEAYAAYKELPYAIRRRRPDDAGSERIRLSEITREIQGRLSYHLSWTAAEAPAVGKAYAELVQELRKVAGDAMRQAWVAPATDDDNQMNIPRAIVDLSSLKPFEDAYMGAVCAHLSALSPWWAR